MCSSSKSSSSNVRKRSFPKARHQGKRAELDVLSAAPSARELGHGIRCNSAYRPTDRARLARCARRHICARVESRPPAKSSRSGIPPARPPSSRSARRASRGGSTSRRLTDRARLAWCARRSRRATRREAPRPQRCASGSRAHSGACPTVPASRTALELAAAADRPRPLIAGLDARLVEKPRACKKGVLFVRAR